MRASNPATYVDGYPIESAALVQAREYGVKASNTVKILLVMLFFVGPRSCPARQDAYLQVDLTPVGREV